MFKHNRLDFFTRFTNKVSSAIGHPPVFVIALLLLLIWAIAGPFFHFSTTWQLLVNTGTTIVTFLMVFIIQNTQNRDSMALNLKLDAIMKKLNITEEELYDAEEGSEQSLRREKAQIEKEVRAMNHTDNKEN
jgi:low affinity Fe/Cu permease